MTTAGCVISKGTSAKVRCDATRLFIWLWRDVSLLKILTSIHVNGEFLSVIDIFVILGASYQRFNFMFEDFGVTQTRGWKISMRSNKDFSSRRKLTPGFCRGGERRWKEWKQQTENVNSEESRIKFRSPLNRDGNLQSRFVIQSDYRFD